MFPLLEDYRAILGLLAALQAMKLEVAGEYMLMASQLMLIKVVSFCLMVKLSLKQMILNKSS